MVKYADRGLANDRYYWNMNLTLFKYLFWVSNISCQAVPQGNMWSFYIKHGYSLFSNTYRTHTCKMTEKSDILLDSLKYHENPDLIRNGNLVFKTWALAFGVLCFFGIQWKRKRRLISVRSYYNVMTLKETLLLLVLLHLDSAILSYFLGGQNKSVFTLEMLRTIFIENLFFKCLVPVYLLFQSKTRLPSLWMEDSPRKIDFYMTKSSFTPRPVFIKTFRNQKEEARPLRKSRPLQTIVTMHSPDGHPRSLPSVE